jgi:hypothetical protein
MDKFLKKCLEKNQYFFNVNIHWYSLDTCNLIVILSVYFRKILAMPRWSQNPERHNQKTLGLFLQCNGESDST